LVGFLVATPSTVPLLERGKVNSLSSVETKIGAGSNRLSLYSDIVSLELVGVDESMLHLVSHPNSFIQD
jgi:hypothetical protein